MFNEVQIKAAKCKASLYYFVKEFWSEVNGDPFYDAWYIEKICDQIQTIAERVVRREPKVADLLCNQPPSTTKTMVFSVFFPAWAWSLDPSLKIITASYSAALSLENSTKSRQIILSEKYKTLFPAVKLKDDMATKSNYQTTANGARYSTSPGATLTGLHGHILIADDPLSAEQAYSEADRKFVEAWYSNTFSSRKVDSSISVVFVVAQRLHELDLFGSLLSKEKIYERVSLPAELCKTLLPMAWAEYYIDGLLDKKRLNEEILSEKKVELGSRVFQAQYNQEPASDKDSLVKEKWIKVISAADFELLKPADTIINFYCDSAFTENSKNDPSAIVAVMRIKNDLYVTSASEVHKSFPDLKRWVEDFVTNNGGNAKSRVKIEPKASGLSLVQELKKNTKLNPFAWEMMKGSKLEKLESVSGLIEAGRLYLVQSHWTGTLIQQLTTKIPAHDDLRDCVVQALRDELIKRSTGKRFVIAIGENTKTMAEKLFYSDWRNN